jgi:uncharacterized membrane protein (UPF0182 family)
MERTLDDAVVRLFGNTDRNARPATTTTGAAAASAEPSSAPGTTASTTNVELNRLAADARDVYQRALEAQRAGDWAKYGEEIKRLGELLERMRSR